MDALWKGDEQEVMEILKWIEQLLKTIPPQQKRKKKPTTRQLLKKRKSKTTPKKQLNPRKNKEIKP
jgi:hypothetical protein